MQTFNTFFLGGFECADHINRSGRRISLLQETQHDVRVAEDYAALSAIGIKTVREGICWSLVEQQPGIFNFDEVLNRMAAAEKYGIQQIWDLIHFGYPDGIYPTHPLFCERFTSLCEAFAHFYKHHSSQQLFVVPINEISFLSWHSGDVRGTVPFAVNSGWDIKYHLCKAAILGISRLKSIDPDCRIVLVEPLVKIHGDAFESKEDLAIRNSHQFQAMDMIGGRMCPELGGREEYLDLLGFNYWNCQWGPNTESLDWPDPEHKRTPLSTLLSMAYSRYQKPIFLSETGHFGCGRFDWIVEVARECLIAKQSGVDLHGICIYPVTDRPDWDDLTRYFDCGIWDLDASGNRIPHQESLDGIKQAQAVFDAPGFFESVIQKMKSLI